MKKEMTMKSILAMSIMFSLILVGIFYAGGLILYGGSSLHNTDINGPVYTFGGHGELTIDLNGSEGFTRESYVEIEEVSYEYLSRKSDLIIAGTVKEILPGKWNTIDGKRPHNSSNDLEWYDVIYTDVVITVDEYLKSSSATDEVVVRVFTGTVDGDVSTADYEPSFQTEEKVFLYLIEDDWEYTKDLGPEHYFVTGSAQGKLTIMDDGTAVGVHGTISQEELVEMISS
ncbi:hypothetical protein [Methanolobus profundi]|uniref:Uncharacterized protein n=1 Tax=Methanolobus profundi TaxID=487685 RepID=A0A1I4R4F4_9EURY|nr:hypothetical protein [Methanolobus profundi]SFM47137.1 hypothetical protein SAMN04488696_1356 [Methanolobus profundi]